MKRFANGCSQSHSNDSIRYRALAQALHTK